MLVAELTRALAPFGLNLIGVDDAGRVRRARAGEPSASAAARRAGAIVVIGNGGGAFWSAYRDARRAAIPSYADARASARRLHGRTSWTTHALPIAERLGAPPGAPPAVSRDRRRRSRSCTSPRPRVSVGAASSACSCIRSSVRGWRSAARSSSTHAPPAPRPGGRLRSLPELPRASVRQRVSRRRRRLSRRVGRSALHRRFASRRASATLRRPLPRARRVRLRSRAPLSRRRARCTIRRARSP